MPVRRHGHTPDSARPTVPSTGCTRPVRTRHSSVRASDMFLRAYRTCRTIGCARRGPSEGGRLGLHACYVRSRRSSRAADRSCGRRFSLASTQVDAAPNDDRVTFGLRNDVSARRRRADVRVAATNAGSGTPYAMPTSRSGYWWQSWPRSGENAAHAAPRPRGGPFRGRDHAAERVVVRKPIAEPRSRRLRQGGQSFSYRVSHVSWPFVR